MKRNQSVPPYLLHTKFRYALVSPSWQEMHFFLRPCVCVREVSQVGAEQAGIELQVVILERLGMAAKLAVHLAQVSQVEQLPQVRVAAVAPRIP
jgi:hypothetical protein